MKLLIVLNNVSNVLGSIAQSNCLLDRDVKTDAWAQTKKLLTDSIKSKVIIACMYCCEHLSRLYIYYVFSETPIMIRYSSNVPISVTSNRVRNILLG